MHNISTGNRRLEMIGTGARMIAVTSSGTMMEACDSVFCIQACFWVAVWTRQCKIWGALQFVIGAIVAFHAELLLFAFPAKEYWRSISSSFVAYRAIRMVPLPIRVSKYVLLLVCIVPFLWQVLLSPYIVVGCDVLSLVNSIIHNTPQPWLLQRMLTTTMNHLQLCSIKLDSPLLDC